MTMHVHHLTGCAPAPLAHYLKGLGILRIVAEQYDNVARGSWQDEHFCLVTAMSRVELEEFFLDEYSPTPFVSPWNKGSGFYAQDDPGLAPVERSTALRFERFRMGIAASRTPLESLERADADVRVLKDRTKAKKGMSLAVKAAAQGLRNDPVFKKELAAAERRFKTLKADIFEPLSLAWRGPHRDWMDAAVVLNEDGPPAWPSLLGTGGNDGRFDFTNNLMQRIGDLFDLQSSKGVALPGSEDSLRQALWGENATGLVPAAIGQFLPGSAGGANSSTGPEGGALVNPWDFVLMMEGSVLFSARSTKRLDPFSNSQASAPFAIRSHAAGSPTRGRENSTRGEQWMPLWNKPAVIADIGAMFGEGRLQIGRRVASRPIDAARSLARLGAARGISAFVRYGYLERNGQSQIAVPLGRVEMRDRPTGRLVDDLAAWIDRLRRLAAADHAPARLAIAEGRLSDSILNALTGDDTAALWQAILVGAVSIEAIQVSGTGFNIGPIPSLSPDWLAATNDGSTEWRLARAIGSAAADYYRGLPVDPVRHHWLPLKRGARQFQQADKHLQRDPRVVIGGRDPISDLAAIVERRLIEAAQIGKRTLPLVAALGSEAHPADIAAFIEGRVDVNRMWALARGFMAIRWIQWRPVQRRGPRAHWPDSGWIAVRLACLPWDLDDGRRVMVDEAIVRRLVAGDAAGAVDIALRRLRSVGLHVPIQGACADTGTARRWAAALACPISSGTARDMARRFERNNPKEIR